MATCLSTVTGLESIFLGFQPGQSYPALKNRRPFPPTHSVLPNLKNFQFKGVIEYFEVFVAQIDAPQLYRLSTTFFDDIYFGPELNKFISRTPIFRTFDEARFIIDHHTVLLRICQSHPEPSNCRMVEVDIFSFLQYPPARAHICLLSSRPLLAIENQPLHLRGSIFTIQLEGCEHRMVGPANSIYSREESIRIKAICTTYRARSAGDHQGQNNRSVVRPAESLLGGFPSVGICRGRHRAVHFCTTAHQSPCRHFYLA
jgi:hypothetical protein